MRRSGKDVSIRGKRGRHNDEDNLRSARAACCRLHTAPAANALTLDNGRNLNGLSFNGLSFNGRNLNGVSFNGRNLNGLSFNGTEREGVVSGNAGQATTIILKDGEHVTLR